MLKKFIATFIVCILASAAYADASKEYDECYAKAIDDDAVAACMKEENSRLIKQIKERYLAISKNSMTKDWNQGNGLVSGRLKDMYQSWLAYRNRYCSLFTVANKKNYGSEDYNHQRCLLELTDDHLKLLNAVLQGATVDITPGHGH